MPTRLLALPLLSFLAAAAPIACGGLVDEPRTGPAMTNSSTDAGIGSGDAGGCGALASDAPASLAALGVSAMCARGIGMSEGTCGGYTVVVEHAMDTEFAWAFDATGALVATADTNTVSWACTGLAPGQIFPGECFQSAFLNTLPSACPTTGVVDAGSTTDAACIYIDPSHYDTSCAIDSDCARFPTGNVCSGSCMCGGTPMNKSQQTKWASDIGGIALMACPCAYEPSVCVAGHCAAPKH